MTENDKKQFAELLADTMEVFEKQVSATTVGIWFNVLQRYTIEEIQYGFSAYMNTGKFSPKPADIVEAISERAGSVWKTADEAFAVVLALTDESSTVIATDAIMEAMDGLWDLVRDNAISGRMAFKEAYERIMKHGKLTGRVPQSFVSVGTDQDKRRDVIENGYRAGLITADQARQHLPRPVTVTGFIAIAGKVADQESDEERKRIAKEALTGIMAMLNKPTSSRTTAERIFEQDGQTMVEVKGVVMTLDQLIQSERQVA